MTDSGVKAGEVKVHFTVDGPSDAPAGSPAVVLSNSLGSTWSMWDAQVPELTKRYKVVRYDVRGHGGSPVPQGPYTIDDLAGDVVALMDRLGLEKAHFVGLSLGGMTGMRLAQANPERVEKLVVLCTAAVLGPAESWHDRAKTVRAEGTAAVADAVVRRWYTDDFFKRFPERATAARDTIAATPAEGYAGCCEAIAAMDLTAELPRITAPTLAIAGAEDPATPTPHLRRIAESVAQGTLLEVPRAAHLANDEQPEIVNQAITEFLGSPTSTR